MMQIVILISIADMAGGQQMADVVQQCRSDRARQ